MLLKSFVTSALLALAVAQPIQQQHQHHQHEKKDVVTYTVYVTAGAAAAAAATSSSTLTTVKASVSSVKTGSTTSTSTTSSSYSYTGSTPTGSLPTPVYGITYSPYLLSGCKSSSQIKSEIAALSDYSVIRLYGIDCSQVSEVMAALATGQKLFVGIYLVSSITADIATLAAAVEANGGWDLIHTVSIGNELVNSGAATVSQISGYLAEARTALTAAGYTGDVVSVDTFIAVINNPGLCDLSDYLAVNAHAYFDGGVTAAEAGEWCQLQIDRLTATCGSDKTILITETGWPTKGNTNGVAVPGSSQQQSALKSIYSAVAGQAFYFNAYNDSWKDDGYYGVEKYWGIYDA